MRQSCEVVISEHRPVPLDHHYAINTGRHAGARVFEMFRSGRQTAPNPEVLMLERNAGLTTRPSRKGRPVRSGPRLRPPRRSDVARQLHERRWLPAIYFLFSRQGCDDAVAQLLRDGVSLTGGDERSRIRELVAERTADLAPDDLAALGFGSWSAGLEHGIAAHHAGMVPVFKEAVEELFVRGLVKVCFATETLALGINMPARTVVIERLEKWDGERHALLSPGQFTQLTGRAGRRGLDRVGHAVVLYQRDVDFHTVASLVSRRTEPLRSSFAPSYNMAVNLLRRHDRAGAEQLLARSFAQFQADARVAGDEQRIARNRQGLEGYATNLTSDRGDFAEYWAIRRELSRLEATSARDRRARRAAAVEQALADLREGDVVALSDGQAALAAVVEKATSRAGAPLLRVVTSDRKLVRIGPREFDRPPVKVGSVALPSSGGPRQSAYRKNVAHALRQIDEPIGSPSQSQAGPDPQTAERIAGLRAAIRAHPVHDDPGLAELETWARRYDDLAADSDKLEQRIRRHTGSLVRSFGRTIAVLTDLGYLGGDPDDPKPTADGLRLAGLYADTDLVLAEAIRAGVLDGLDQAELAAVLSAFVYETRLKEAPEPLVPTVAVGDALKATEELWEELTAREEAAGLTLTRAPDAGFADTVWRWASGADLDDTLGDSDQTAGDFVRNVKQVADLARQVRDAADDRPELAAAAAAASRSLLRGVVAYTGL